MLPPELQGPGQTIAYAGATAVSTFLRENSARYPHLDRDFIVQICFEHARRFNELLPRFDVGSHGTCRVSRSAAWIRDSVRYDRGERVDFWQPRFRELLAANDVDDELFGPMMATRTWPFPPVVIESRFALSLGAPSDIGTPYYLVEGTHRASYLGAMLELGLIEETSEHMVIEIEPLAGPSLGSFALLPPERDAPSFSEVEGV